MNNPLHRTHEPALDPDYATRERKEARRFWGSLLIAVAAIALGTWAAIGTAQNSTEITEIQHSACAADPASIECQKIKAESDREQPVVFACIPIQKIAKDQRLLALTKCKEAAERAQQNSGSKGVVPSTGDSPSSEPSPHHGGVGNGQGKGSEPQESGGGNSAEQPSKAPEPAPTPQPSGVTEPPPVSESATPKQPVREAVGQVGETVNGALEGVGHTGCALLNCPNP